MSILGASCGQNHQKGSLYLILTMIPLPAQQTPSCSPFKIWPKILIHNASTHVEAILQSESFVRTYINNI